MDIILAVTAAQLNTAGQQAHTHTNRAVLDAITEAPATAASMIDVVADTAALAARITALEAPWEIF